MVSAGAAVGRMQYAGSILVPDVNQHPEMGVEVAVVPNCNHGVLGGDAMALMDNPALPAAVGPSATAETCSNADSGLPHSGRPVSFPGTGEPR